MSETAIVTMLLKLILATIENMELEIDNFFRRHIEEKYPKLYKEFYDPVSPMIPLVNLKWDLRNVIRNLDDPYIGILELLKKEDKLK